MKNNVLEAILLIVGLIVLAAILLALPLQLLWNWLMPQIFNLPMITFWQALGLNMMSGILFKSNVNIKKED
jgi:hypothetical protein